MTDRTNDEQGNQRNDAPDDLRPNEGSPAPIEEASTDFGRHSDEVTDTTVPENPTEDGSVEEGTRLDDELSSLGADALAGDMMSEQTVTNDAVAGETVFPGAGIRNEGPTGGSPSEVEPIYDEHETEDIVLADESADAARPAGGNDGAPH